MTSRYSVLLGGKTVAPPPSVQSVSEQAALVTPPTEGLPNLEMASALPILSKPTIQGQPTEVLLHQNDSMTARQQDSKPSNPLDSMTASRQASKPPRQHDGKAAGQHPSLRDFLDGKATEKTTIRLPKELVQYLEDTLYLIKREQNVKLTMKAIFIVALASFCQEFDLHGPEGLLYKKLLEELQ